jgi:hypothetical protein
MARRLPPAGEGTGLTLLLLAGSVEYLRGNKYSGLSALVTQDHEAGKSRGAVEEEEYLRVAVERILKQRPDLLLLEGFMANAGLDLLRNAGVTVVINVKRKGVYSVPALASWVLWGERALDAGTYVQYMNVHARTHTHTFSLSLSVCLSLARC